MPFVRPFAAVVCAANVAWADDGAPMLGAPAPLRWLDGGRPAPLRAEMEPPGSIRQTGGRQQDTSEVGRLSIDDAIPGYRAGDASNPPPVYDRYNTLSSTDRPFRADYTLLGRSGVKAPDGGSVLMQEFSGRWQLRAPLGSSASLRLQPFANIMFLNGPQDTALQLPGHLFKFAVDTELDYRAGENWLLSAAVTPGFWTDLKALPGFRLPARVLAAYRVHEGLYFGGGVIYTANYYHNLLPTIGLLWDVSDRLRLELVAPRGRVVYTLHDDLQFYAAVEGGGDTYLIRSYGENVKLQYRDYRFLVGAEFAAFRRASFLLEAGYAFNRRIRIENQDDRNLDPGLFARFGARF